MDKLMLLAAFGVFCFEMIVAGFFISWVLDTFPKKKRN